ncbi:terminal nucleotidyltransferase 4B [Rhodamnia argentea]|uniref:polynucleotide adenylyltransferase n=1 Tax=Rhodamnia argentea TaxID=178133 RepID=A0A8B8MR44_9MYRT|nr:terminal nucleotidyltransferase 4B [Rhodamnia argentea]
MEEDIAPQSYLYETLSPLSLSAATVADRSPSPPSDYEPYSVFRSEISLRPLPSASSDTAVPDYFSLDVGAEPEPLEALAAPVPSAAELAEPKTPAREPKTRLESGWFRGNSRFASPMLQLHKEIVDFCDFLSPTPEEEASRNEAVKSVFGVIKYIWPNCSVEVFGSFRTRLYLPTSDIDVVILDSGIRTPQLGLQALSRALSQKSIAKNIQVIAKARVPIVKFVEKRSGVAFDISFDVDNGPKAAEFIKDAISKWPPLRPLCLILKVFLQQRELNEVYSGGIGSYALLTMLMAMLRSIHERQAFREHNLGVLLVQFFDFYGRKLNTSDVGVSCRGTGTFYLKRDKGFLNKGRPSLISIEDPQTPDNDIGKNSFNYFQIRSAFAMAFTTLTNSKAIKGLGPNRSILGLLIRSDPVLIERKGGSRGDVTFSSLLPGAGESVQLNLVDPPEIFCNWQLDDEEEPLPRGSGASASVSKPSKKRKSVSEGKSSRKKVKEGRGVETPGREENGTKKEKSAKKKYFRHGQFKANGYSHHSGSYSER